MNASLADAERAKQKAQTLLARLSTVNGIGIALLEGGYGVKVNLRSDQERASIPEAIDGVPVIVAIVGVITAD